jgi:hypothetical protein
VLKLWILPLAHKRGERCLLGPPAKPPILYSSCSRRTLPSRLPSNPGFASPSNLSRQPRLERGRSAKEDGLLLPNAGQWMRVASGERSQAYSASVVGLVSNCASACPRPCIGSKAVKMSRLRSEVCLPITHRRTGDRAQRSESTLLRGVVNTT